MKKALTTEEFIDKANKIHNNYYDYSKVIYKSTKAKVIIICPQHGEFLQNAGNHLAKHECPKCARKKIIIEKTLTNQEFINKSVKVHNNKYDGEQHYKITTWFNNSIKFNDAIKTKFCKDNNIELIRIPYTDFDNIESILKTSLNIDNNIGAVVNG